MSENNYPLENIGFYYGIVLASDLIKKDRDRLFMLSEAWYTDHANWPMTIDQKMASIVEAISSNIHDFDVNSDSDLKDVESYFLDSILVECEWIAVNPLYINIVRAAFNRGFMFACKGETKNLTPGEKDFVSGFVGASE